jgi:hypothetical protein
LITLTYQGKKESISSGDTIDSIKKKFAILDRKNLYRIKADGELVKLDEHNLAQELKGDEKIEALSDFALG